MVTESNHESKNRLQLAQSSHEEEERRALYVNGVSGWLLSAVDRTCQLLLDQVSCQSKTQSAASRCRLCLHANGSYEGKYIKGYT